MRDKEICLTAIKTLRIYHRDIIKYIPKEFKNITI